MEDKTKEKVKILIIAETYPPEINGASRFGKRLVEGLSQIGYKVYVIAPHSNKHSTMTVSEDNGIVEYRLPSHAMFSHQSFRMCFPWQIKKAIATIFNQVQPDVVHIQCHFSIGRVAVKEAYARQIPIVATLHVMPENITPYLPLPSWLINHLINYLFYDLKKVLSKVNTITIPTDLAAKVFKERIDLPILTISNGINSEEFELKKNEIIQKKTNPTVLFVGRIAREKHIDVLIKAISMLPRELNIHLNVVGDGEIIQELKNLAHNLHIAKNVTFLGVLSEESLRLAYLQATLFCMPGTAELQSLATLEAMSASLPVVLADALALPHLVTEGDNGFLFRPNDSADLAEKIKKILELPEDLQFKMGQSSRKMVTQHQIKNTLSRFEAVYKALI